MIFYKQDDTKQDDTKLLDVLVDDNSYRYREIMGDNTLTLYFSLAEHVEIPLGAYVDYQGERYTLMRPEALKMNHTRSFEYTVTLESAQAKAKIWKFRCVYTGEKSKLTDGRLKFSLTAKPKEHLQMFVDNMNRRDKGWSIGECIEDSEKCISYDHAYCWDALGQMADEFNTEFEIINKEVSLHKVEYNKTTPLPLSYGKGNGFKTGVERTNYEDTPPIEFLYTQGGTDNIDSSKYGSSELHLPKNGTISYDGVYFEDEEDFDASSARQYVADDKGYAVSRLDGKHTSLAEDSLDCSSIYPQRVGKVGEVISVNVDNNFYDFVDNSIPDDLNYEDYLIDGEDMTIIFQSGMLSGKEFDVKYYHKATGQKKAKRFEIVPQEIDGQTMPNETFKPAQGDTYAVFGCYLPDGYINTYAAEGDPKNGAEWDMMRQAVKYLYDNETENFSFAGTLDGIYAKKNWTNIGDKIRLGGFVLFSDARFQKEGVRIRIINIKDYINTPYAPEIELSNSTVTGSFSSTLQELKSTEVLAEERTRNVIQFTKRRFRDAKETLSMLEAALLDNFTNSIQPITVQTMAMLVGDESLQFRFVGNMVSPEPVECGVTYDQATKTLYCPQSIIQHMTLGIDTLAPSHDIDEYMFWDMEEYTSGQLDDGDTKYYLYAKVSRTDKTGFFLLLTDPVKIDEDDDGYYLLVGVLNSEYDGERSFVTLYGFTEVLPGRITTDRIVSTEGNSYFDLVGDAMKLGDMLDFNSEGDGQLRLKGTIVQSLSGDSNYIGCFRGEYNETLTYYQGDEVTYEIEGCTSTYRYVSSTPASGVLPTDTDHWQVIAQGVQGTPGISPNTAYKSTVFQRSTITPSRPVGGTYASPVPSGWSDGIPSGEAQLWAATRIFSSDGKSPQQKQWSLPSQLTDTADFDIVFSSETAPTAPTGHPNTNTQWTAASSEDTVWMATARKSNSVWNAWQVSKIKGEKGADGSSIKIMGEAYDHCTNYSDWKADLTKKVVLIDKETVTTSGTETTNYRIVVSYYKAWGDSYYDWHKSQADIGDAYLMVSSDETVDGCLFVAQSDGWANVGHVQGAQGKEGAEGKSSYLHVKYANSLTENDWSDNDGETPADYIGTYVDNNPTDQLVWSLYAWKKWVGEDGFGYEYIYQRTATDTAPDTPTETSQEDDFVPDGWTDDPSGVTESEQYEWLCYRKRTYGVWGAFIGSTADNSKAALWAKYGDKGDAGDKGDYTELRFAKNGSITTPPTLNTTIADPAGWTVVQPSVGVAEYLWMTTAKKSGKGVLIGTWSTPVRVTPKDGVDGKSGRDGLSPAMVYRGNYDATKTYYGNAYRLDCVKSGNTYYITRIDAGEFVGIAPPDTTKWNSFGASFESVATELLLADEANLAGWVYRNERMESQATDSEGNPMVYLDGKNGEMRLRGTLQHSTGVSGVFSDVDLFSLPARTSGASVSMGHEKEDIGKRCLLTNLSELGSLGYYTIVTNKFGWIESDPKTTYIESAGSFLIEPGTTVEMTCFQLPKGSNVLGRSISNGGYWTITNRFHKEIAPVVAMGIVTNSEVGASIVANSIAGSDFTVSRSGTGQADGLYTITMPSYFDKIYNPIIMLTGKGYVQGSSSAPTKATLVSQSGRTFVVCCADDASMNAGSFMFVIYSFGGWH